MKYKHIIWDWNGTLLDDRNFCIDIMNNVLRRRGMNKMTEAWFLENFCFPVKDYYKKLGFDLEKEPFEISGDEFIDEYALL
jgi:phosphoglycolate phosphatase